MMNFDQQMLIDDLTEIINHLKQKTLIIYCNHQQK